MDSPKILSVLQESQAECGHDGCREQYGTCDMLDCPFTAYYKCIIRRTEEKEELNICDIHFKNITVDTSKMKVDWGF